jgi:hypothetical protein
VTWTGDKTPRVEHNVIYTAPSNYMAEKAGHDGIFLGRPRRTMACSQSREFSRTTRA